MTDVWRLDTLPCDVLLLIFDYCHAFDLVRLSEVCTRFHKIIREDAPWIMRRKYPLATNQASRKFRERCNPLLCLRKRWHVSHNWQYGKYEKRSILSQKTKLMPWIQLTADVLWWSGGNRLCAFRRGNSFRQGDCIFNYENFKSDVCKFIVRDDYVIAGFRDGSLKFWARFMGDQDIYYRIEKAHLTDIDALDEFSKLIVTGSADGVVKIWNPKQDEEFAHVPSAVLSVPDRIWSMAIDPLGTKFAVGSAGICRGSSLHMFDLECYSESGILKHKWNRGGGILDMVWENPHTLLTCGYDTYIRKWDMRTGTCVNAWEDPTDATVYSIASDYQHTMVTGTQFNCKAVLWDQRQKHYVQLYFMSLDRISSPIYSINFDSSHLYAATDQHLVELTFSGYNYKQTNYREILKTRWMR